MRFPGFPAASSSPLMQMPTLLSDASSGTLVLQAPSARRCSWLVAIVGVNLAVRGVGSNYQDNFSLPQTQSFQAMSLLQRAAPKARATRPAGRRHRSWPRHRRHCRARMEHLLARVARLPHVTEIGSPYAPSAVRADLRTPARLHSRRSPSMSPPPNLWTRGGRLRHDDPGRLRRRRDVRGDGQVAEDGNPSSPSTALPLGFVAAGLVLLLVFGTLPAMLLPLLPPASRSGPGSRWSACCRT